MTTSSVPASMYAYAFVKTPSTPLDLPMGIANPVRIIGTNQISALVEAGLSLDGLQQDDSRLMQAVLAHDRVIRGLFTQTTLLPLRFGTCFVSPEGLLAHLASYQDQYQTRLDWLQGKAEYTLKFTSLDLTVDTIPSDTKGKAYFLAKKQHYEAHRQQRTVQTTELQQVLAAIAQTYPDYRFNPAETPPQTVYLLIEQQAEPLLTQNFQHWQQQCPQWQITLGEALPPYHFS